MLNLGGRINIIEAQVPLAEILRYAIGLKSITQRSGSYNIEFIHYEEVQLHFRVKIIAERQDTKKA